MTAIKRAWALILILMLLCLSLPAPAQDSGHRFEADSLGLRMVIDERWIKALADGTLQFWLRVDPDAQKDGVLGYALVYQTASLDGFAADTYPEAEAWLNAHCALLGGVVAHERDAAGVDALYGTFTRTALGAAGDTSFTLIRPAEAPDGDLAHDVWAALADEGRFELFDPARDYGLLGVFEATDLNGLPVSNEMLYDAKLTVVNFWGTYCPPCIEEMPIMGRLAAEYAEKGVKFLGVVTDAYDAETLELAAQIAEQTGANYPHIPPVVSSGVLSQIQYIPTTVFLDSNGQKVGETEVGGLTEQQWIEAIESRLEQLGGVTAD